MVEWGDETDTTYGEFYFLTLFSKGAWVLPVVQCLKPFSESTSRKLHEKTNNRSFGGKKKLAIQAFLTSLMRPDKNNAMSLYGIGA